MAAVVVMVASSQDANRRPKSGPPANLSAATTTADRGTSSDEETTQQKSPVSSRDNSALEFHSTEKERANLSGAAGAGGSNSMLRYVNESAEFTNADTASIPVNIDTNSTVILRRRGRKAPKPLPYLQPISTYLAAAAVKDRNSTPFDGHFCEPRRRKRVVTFAAPSSSRSGRIQRIRQHRAGRVNNEKLSRGQKSVLAYLVVDLECGTISSSSEDVSKSMETLTGTTTGQQSPLLEAGTRERSVTTPATFGSSKPIPRPRKKRTEKDDPEHHTSGDSGRESVTSPTPPPRSPAKKPTPDREETPPATQVRSSSTSSAGSCQSTSLVSARKSIFEQKDDKLKSPQNTPPPPPIRKSSIPVRACSQTSPTPPPVLHQESHSLSTTEERANSPPPLPAKSELSRKIQKSIKSKKKMPPPPPPSELPSEPPSEPQPYEAASPLELDERFDTHTNDSYGTQELENDYEISDPEDKSPPVNMADDKPEEMYIDPTVSKQFSSTGKPRPPRPPPPSSSAIKKAQRKKAAAAVSATLKAKPLTKRHSSPALRAHTIGRHNVKNTSRERSHVSTSSFPSPAKPILSLEDDKPEQIYEDLDVGASSGPSILWKPPTAENPTPTVIIPATMGASSMAESGPSLPPRAHKPALAPSSGRGRSNTTDGTLKTGKSSENLSRSPRPRQITPVQEEETESLELQSDDEADPVMERYEPIDASMPLAPQRNKRNVKGTHTSTSPRRAMDNVYNKNPEPSPKSARQAPRRSAPPPPTPYNNKADRKGTIGGRSPKIDSREKTDSAKSLSGKLSVLNMTDEGGVEEYVDMDYNNEGRNSEEEDGPDTYVDMQPPKKFSENIDETSSPLRPYVKI